MFFDNKNKRLNLVNPWLDLQFCHISWKIFQVLSQAHIDISENIRKNGKHFLISLHHFRGSSSGSEVVSSYTRLESHIIQCYLNELSIFVTKWASSQQMKKVWEEVINNNTFQYFHCRYRYWLVLIINIVINVLIMLFLMIL